MSAFKHSSINYLIWAFEGFWQGTQEMGKRDYGTSMIFYSALTTAITVFLYFSARMTVFQIIPAAIILAIGSHAFHNSENIRLKRRQTSLLWQVFSLFLAKLKLCWWLLLLLLGGRNTPEAYGWLFGKSFPIQQTLSNIIIPFIILSSIFVSSNVTLFF